MYFLEQKCHHNGLRNVSTCTGNLGNLSEGLASRFLASTVAKGRKNICSTICSGPPSEPQLEINKQLLMNNLYLDRVSCFGTLHGLMICGEATANTCYPLSWNDAEVTLK